MRRFILVVSIFLLLSNSLFSSDFNECRVEVFYGNGMSNTGETLDKMKTELEKFLNERSLQRNLNLRSENYKVRLSKNEMTNWVEQAYTVAKQYFNQYALPNEFKDLNLFQLLEYIERDREGSVTPPDFFKGNDEQWTDLRAELLEQKDSILKSGVYDDPILQKHIASYKKSIEKGGGVFIVAHSQGNFYANLAYGKIQEEKLNGNMSLTALATPADIVAGGNSIEGKDAWMINTGDFVQYLSNLPANNTNSGENGHYFYDSYLKGNHSSDKIYTNVYNMISSYLQAPSRWKVAEDSDSKIKEVVEDYMLILTDSLELKEEKKALVFGEDSGKLFSIPIQGTNDYVNVIAPCSATEVIDHTAQEIYDENGRRVLFSLEGSEEKIYGSGAGSCKELLEDGNEVSGVYSVLIEVDGVKKDIDVYCDMETEGGGWMYAGSIENYGYQRNGTALFSFSDSPDVSLIGEPSNKSHVMLRDSLSLLGETEVMAKMSFRPHGSTEVIPDYFTITGENTGWSNITYVGHNGSDFTESNFRFFMDSASFTYGIDWDGGMFFSHGAGLGPDFIGTHTFWIR